MVSTTKFSFLEQYQRDEFMKRWYSLKEMIEKWTPDMSPGAPIAVFANRKNLEQEIEDLEDISLSAYRAMKCLRKKLADAIESADDYAHISCPCGKNLSRSGYIQILGVQYCNQQCLADSKKKKTPEPRVGEDGEIHGPFYSCADCGDRLVSGYLSIYGKHFCDPDCMQKWEQDYDRAAEEYRGGYAG